MKLREWTTTKGIKDRLNSLSTPRVQNTSESLWMIFKVDLMRQDSRKTTKESYLSYPIFRNSVRTSEIKWLNRMHHLCKAGLTQIHQKLKAALTRKSTWPVCHLASLLRFYLKTIMISNCATLFMQLWLWCQIDISIQAVGKSSTTTFLNVI